MFQLNFTTLTAAEIALTAAQKLSTELADWEKHVWQFILDWNNSSINTIEVSTSGSTGEPQKIYHTKKHVIVSAKNTCQALSLNVGCSALLCLPANKISGSMMLVRSMVNRMNLICIKPSATPLSDLTEDIKIDFAAFTPSQLFEVMHNNISLKKLEKIEHVILGGENIQPTLKSKLENFKTGIYQTFGMTETISHIALKKISGSNKSKYYKLMPDIGISIDKRNCLVIKAPTLGQPVLVTNDVVSIISDKEFEWLGRFDNVINSGGIKLYPEIIEEQLKTKIETPFFITGINSTKTGNTIALVLEKSTLSENELVELKSVLLKLDSISRPKKLFFVPTFSRTENGKISRNKTLINQIDSIDL